MLGENEDIYICSVLAIASWNKLCQAIFYGFCSVVKLGPPPLRSQLFLPLGPGTQHPSPRLRSGSSSSHPADAMDSPVVTHIFRQLFRHRGCQISHPHPCALLHNPFAPRPRSHRQSRTYASKPTLRRRTLEDPTFWKHRTDDFPRDMSKELREYPMVTSTDLRSRPHRPRRVKMLARDFIEGILHMPRLIALLVSRCYYVFDGLISLFLFSRQLV